MANALSNSSAIAKRAASLLATDPVAAGRDAESILRHTPRDPRALLILASSRRWLGDLAAARAILVPLAKAYPQAANTQHELGLTLAAAGETTAAIAAQQRAVSLDRDLAAAWRALGDLLFRDGDLSGADAAFAQHTRATLSDSALKDAAEALFEGHLADAEQILRAHLNVRPNDADALHLLAEAYSRQSSHSEAEVLLRRCLELDPCFDGARFAYAKALFRQQKGTAALAQMERLAASDPLCPPYRNLVAACLTLVGEDERAIALYGSLVAEYPRQPQIWLNYAHSLRTVGRTDEAITAYRRSIALAPGLGEAYWGLANLKVAALTCEDETNMEARLEHVDGNDRVLMAFALGSALEDRAQYAVSFARYAEGAALHRAKNPYSADIFTSQCRRAQALFTANFFAQRAGSGSSAADPIFVLGLPRSGSTLVEQILASHSAVEGTAELPDIGLIAKRLGAETGSFPECLAELSPEQFTELGENYLDNVRVHRKLGRRFFIDKMPNNFHHVGLIHLILPKAKIIDVRRYPLGACFSAFKQHFAQGHSFSYSLTDLGLYYRDYVDLMSHFDRVLPGRIFRLIYEDLVADPSTQVRRLLEHCELPFDARCLRFHETKRPVRTVSSEQVRRPIFREGLEQWRHYEPWLGPLKLALGSALERWRR